eukprot:766764-Hanusia_phi.AAC.8
MSTPGCTPCRSAGPRGVRVRRAPQGTLIPPRDQCRWREGSSSSGQDSAALAVFAQLPGSPPPAPPPPPPPLTPFHITHGG